MTDHTNPDADGTTQPARAIGRQDAGAKFGTARADSLRGALARRPVSPPPASMSPTESPVESSEDLPTVETQQREEPQQQPFVPQARTATPTPRPQRAARTSQPSPQKEGQKRNYSFRVPVATMNQLRDEREKRHVRNDTVVFDAIDALVDAGSQDPYARLREVVSKATSGLSTAAPSLFERSGVKALSDDDQATTVQCLIRVTPRNQEVLDSLVSAVGALDRGHMINAALEHFFANR